MGTEVIKKTLQELVFKDNFMFAAVMMDEENAKNVLECVLDERIDHVEVSKEKSLIYHPEYKGVRLDVYAKDRQGKHYNVEMQVHNDTIPLRARYYHSQVDVEILEKGVGYGELPDTFVVFICDYDPIGLGKYKYTVRKTFEEDSSYLFDDGSYTILLNTKGHNESEVSDDLVQFLKFAGANLGEDTKVSDNRLVTSLQTSVAKIKKDREMGCRYMLLEELLDQRMAQGIEIGMERGLEQGLEQSLVKCRDYVISTASARFNIPSYLEEQIRTIRDLDALMGLNATAFSCNDLQAFEAEVEKVLIRQ